MVTGDFGELGANVPKCVAAEPQLGSVSVITLHPLPAENRAKEKIPPQYHATIGNAHVG